MSTPIAINPFNPDTGERGISARVLPHVFTTYVLYEVPFKRSQQGFLGHALGGWQLSGTHRYQTGVAVTPVQNTIITATPTVTATSTTTLLEALWTRVARFSAIQMLPSTLLAAT